MEEVTDRTMPVALNLFWFGFIVYTASFAISTSGQVSYVGCNVAQIIGLLLILPTTVLLANLRIVNNYLRIVFFIYFFWLVGTVIRGIEFDYLTAKQMLFNPNSGLFPYLVPLVILIPVNGPFLKKTFSSILAIGLIYWVYDLIFIKQLLYPMQNMASQSIYEHFTQYLCLPCGFILLTYIYHSRKLNLFALSTMVIAFVLGVIRARRGLIFMTFSILLFTYLMYQLANKTKVINIILSLFFIVLIAFVAVKVYDENRKGTFGLITERIGQRTRSEVEQYFYRDLGTKDWIIGKGINGKYFCPGVMEGEGKITIHRTVIETGFLQIILNGGLVSLVLFLLITVPAMFKGLFFSRNFLSKAAGIWILLLFLNLYPGMPVIFSLNYILAWISVVICYSDELRNLSDTEIMSLLKNR